MNLQDVVQRIKSGEDIKENELEYRIRFFTDDYKAEIYLTMLHCGYVFDRSRLEFRKWEKYG